MNNKLLKLTKKPFVRNVITAASGSTLAQVINVAFTPFITRLYGPEAFGLLGTFLALMIVMIPVAALSYPLAIVLPKEDTDARGIARLSAFISLAVAAFTAIVLWIGGEKLLIIIGSQAIAGFIFLIPLCMIFTAWFDISQQFMIRKKRFNVVAQADVLQAFIINSAKVAIGWFQPLAAVLIVLSTVRIAMHAGILGLKSRMSRETEKKLWELKDKTSLCEVAKRYYDFPVYRAPQAFVNALSQSLPVLMLASFFGPVSAGFYVLGRRLLTMPSQLLGTAVGNVFYPRITEAAHNREDFSRLILKTTLGLAAIGILPFAIIVAVGPWLFSQIFGAEWKIAGEYARWLSFSMFSAFVSRPSVVSIPVLNMQRFFLMFEIISVGLLSFVLFISFYIFRNDIITIFSFSAVGVLLNFSLILITIRKNSNNNNRRTG